MQVTRDRSVGCVELMVAIIRTAEAPGPGCDDLEWPVVRQQKWQRASSFIN